MKVVIARAASKKTKRMMAAQFPDQWDCAVVPPDDLINQISDADVIIPEGAGIDEGILKKAQGLKLVQTGAGYDNVDVKACTERGIWVANAAGINAGAVAEHVFALILCWHKNIITLDKALKSGHFSMDYDGAELSQKVIGIVGLGSIGREVARLAKAFDMEIIGHHYRPTRVADSIKIVDLPALLEKADVISLHVALNSQTRHMIGKPEFELMKPGAFFINTSRGGVVDEQALIKALQHNRIGGAGLDVFEAEPLPESSPLRKMDNVILSPHSAGEPEGLYFHRKRFQYFADNILRVISGKAPRNALNDLPALKTDPGRLIPEVILPEGYNGKILLVSVSADGIDKTVLLRSGDIWHREILRNTETEIKNLGYENAKVYQLGGARVRFEADGTIIIYGTSDEFGACDKDFAATLIRKTYPENTVNVRN